MIPWPDEVFGMDSVSGTITVQQRADAAHNDLRPPEKLLTGPREEGKLKFDASGRSWAYAIWEIPECASYATLRSSVRAPQLGPHHASRYELQMLLYGAAAARHVGSGSIGPIDATLYFLRPAATHTFPMTAETLKGAAARVQRLARTLITSRRTGQFRRANDQACPRCPYARLCRGSA